MKKINLQLFISAVLLLLVGVSCSDDFLKDMKNYDKVNEGTLFTSVSGTTSRINFIYYQFYSAYKSPVQTLVGSFSDEKTKMTEEMGGSIGDLINPQVSLNTADDASGYYGQALSGKVKNDPYDRIRDCSFIINNIDDLGSGLNETFRDRAKGQMYYLRAIQYFDLIRTYGGVPIVTTAEQATSGNLDIKLPRASVEQVVAQIVSDLDEASTLLPGKWDDAGVDYGRPTSGAALAHKARVLLTFASPLFNNDWDNTGNERWEQARLAGIAAKQELEANGYGLTGSSGKDWENLFLVDNSFCPEAITVQFCSSSSSVAINNSWESNIRLTSQNGGGGVAVPRSMIDLFPMADGSQPTTADLEGFNYLKNRDPRFYRTFGFSGCKWDYSGSADDAVVWAYEYKDQNDIVYYSDNNNVKSPVFVRKMTNTGADGSSFSYSSTDIFEYRFAELVLGIAECNAAQGKVQECLDYLGEIRNRVGISSVNNYGIGNLSNKYEAIKACLYERRVELAYEGKRFWDIQRWMLYNDDASTSNNTCAQLGLDAINGTNRKGSYLLAKEISTDGVDPLVDARASIVVDIDSEDFNSQIETLVDFYNENFEVGALDQPLDNINGEEVNIDWKQNYYLSGLRSNVLTANPWLKQTIGWLDAYGTEGTFDYQE